MPSMTRFHCALVLWTCLSPALAQDDPYDRAASRVADDLRGKVARERAVREEHATWADPWIVESPHYRVRVAESWILANGLSQGLETMRERFTALIPGRVTPGGRSAIFVLPTLADYQQFGDDHGDARSSFYGSFYASGHPEKPVATYVDSNATRQRMTVTHGATLQYLDQAFPNRSTPAWIDYGLASYFHLQWAYTYGVDELNRLEGSGFIPLSNLLAIQVDGNGASLNANNAHAHFMELGMLFNYLLHYREDTRTDPAAGNAGAFAKYLRAALAGQDVSTHPVHQLLFEQTAQLEADLKAYEFPR
ncbi:MAG: hypothetical protein RL885_12040 [Planctomycetota bacterium]